MNTVIHLPNQYKTGKAYRKSNCYDIHKRSELKDIYSSIVNISKESPIYKFESPDSLFHAIDLKEEAGLLKNNLTAVADNTNPDAVSKNKIVVSSDPETVSVEYFEGFSNPTDAEGFVLEVQNLASSQINTGTFLPDGKLKLIPNEYSFDIQTNNLCYGFQFHVSHTDTNLSLQEKLAHMINKTKLGVTASILRDSAMGFSALQLESTATGIPHQSSSQTHFTVIDDSASYTSGAAKYLGIEAISQYPKNASYVLDGESRSASSNTILVHNSFEVTLKKASDNKPVFIGFKTNLDSIIDHIRNFTDSYNSMLTLSSFQDEKEVKSSLLYNSIRSAAYHNRNSLDAVGLTVTENGSIKIDDNLLSQALTEDVQDTIQSLSEFRTALSGITEQIYFNPMNFVNKTIVLYPNPGKSFANPYLTSMYSGMLFTGCC